MARKAAETGGEPTNLGDDEANSEEESALARE